MGILTLSLSLFAILQAVEEARTPTFPQQLECMKDEVRIGKSFKLVCTIDAYPEAKTTWYFNGEKIKRTRKHQISMEGANKHILHVLDVTQEDEGNSFVKASVMQNLCIDQK